MPTKFDVFAEIIERAPCKPSELPFDTPIYAHISSLKKDGWIKDSKVLLPVKNKKTIDAFNIIKYCLKNGLNYNKFFSKNISKIIIEISKNVPLLRPEKLKNNKENVNLINYLEFNQFILLIKNRPKKGILLNHQLLNFILSFNNINYSLKRTKFLDVSKKVFDLTSNEMNPFDNKIFSFLSGSAQLEGSTISAGETKELIMNDIYPEKPKKDIQMIKNLNEALHYVFENLHKKITPETIQDINRLILFGLHRNAGKFKLTHNKIQGTPNFKTAHPNQVGGLINGFCEDINKLSKEDLLNKVGYLHNQLQYIHPFSDGNSRTTRMIINWLMLKYKLPILIIKMGSFDEYMRLTKLSTQRDDSSLTKLFYHLLIHEELISRREP